MIIIDSHAHINDDIFFDLAEQYINESKKENVGLFLCVGWDLESSRKAVEISEKFNEVFACVGIHPEEIKNMHKNDFENIKKLLNNKKVIAIGEVGLDFFKEKEKQFQDQQKEYFIKFIELANEFNLPIVVHSRDAELETLNILEKYRVDKKGVIHCCTFEKNTVNEFIKLGFFFGVGGIVTFKNSLKIKESVKNMPLERILLETDAPYLTPYPVIGQKNHSKYLKYIIKTISDIKNINDVEIINQTTKNFSYLFNVKI